SVDAGAAVLFLVGTALLAVMFGGMYGGDVRHHGFFFVLFLMGAWIVLGGPPSEAPSRWSRFRRAAIVPTLTTLLVVHIPAGAIAIAYDYRYIFSSGRRAADVLRAQGL